MVGIVTMADVGTPDINRSCQILSLGPLEPQFSEGTKVGFDGPLKSPKKHPVTSLLNKIRRKRVAIVVNKSFVLFK